MRNRELMYGDALCHAYLLYTNCNYIYLDDDMCQIDIIKLSATQETDTIRKYLYEDLSKEAKFVIDLILKAPTEVVEELKKVKLPGYQNYLNGYMQSDGFSSNKDTAIFKKERLAVYLRKKWGKRLLVRQVINELEEYAKELGRI